MKGGWGRNPGILSIFFGCFTSLFFFGRSLLFFPIYIPHIYDQGSPLDPGKDNFN